MKAKKAILGIAIAAVATVATVAMTSAGNADEVMTRTADGTYVVNTTTLASTVKGYAGATPLKIYIKNDKVVKIEALPNQETRSIFARVKRTLLDKWNGNSVKTAAKMQVDAASGATYSSNAVKENVKRGLAYYKKHRK